MAETERKVYPGIEVAGHRSDTLGRYLTATRDFTPGDLIAEFDAPLLALPDVAHQQTTCNYCLSQAPVPLPGVPDTWKLRACTACSSVRYCSTRCQKADWAFVHAKECKALKEVRKSSGNDWLPTPVRAVMQVLLRANDASIQAAFFGDSQREDLQGNFAGFRTVDGGKFWKDMELQAVAASVYGGFGEGRDKVEKAREILCKIHTNAFDRADLDSDQAGIFLEPTLAMINHSCLPNAFVSFHKRAAILRAEASIKAGDEIQISYIDNTMPRSARHAHLKLYHLDCKCQRCRDDLDVYQVCQHSQLLSLNRFSLAPRLEDLRAPPLDAARYANLSKRQIEQIYDDCQQLTSRGLERLSHRWRLCQPLLEAKTWALDPLAQTVVETAIMLHSDRGNYANALSLACFAAIRADPYKFVAPFKPWRIKGALMIARLLAVTAPLSASGQLAKSAAHEAVVRVLSLCDQASMCEAMLLMVLHWGPVGHSEKWPLLQMAKVMMADIHALPGREKQTALLAAWAANQDGEGQNFFESQVLRPIEEVAAFAPDILAAELRCT